MKNIDVIAASSELAQLMKEDRSIIEKEIIQKGDQILGIFVDETMRDSFQDLRAMKIEAIKLIIDDLSSGGKTLRRSTMGLTFSKGKIHTFIEPFGSAPAGNVIFSVNLKNVFAFKNWRTDEALDIPQEEINAAIYRLTMTWSELL